MNKILVVEDEAAIADTLIHVLTMEGFDVQWLTLGSDALELLRQQRIDLVILDVGLPDINGFEVCKQIRQFSDLP
ncbi:MAG: response regulator, partial [Psychrobium sp.]|nr:response regulator [Psychrobium sp.]